MALATPRRNTVLWLGTACPQDFSAACRERGLNIVPVTPATCSGRWGQARAIVFHEPDDILQEQMRSGLVADALNHGLYVRTLATKPAVPALNDLLRSLAVSLVLTAWDVSGLLPTAEAIARHDPLMGIDTVSLKGCERCEAEDLVLLRRAFSDCSEVEFQALTADHRRIFQAFARLRASVAGPYPLPFLVKLESYKRAEREIRGYAAGTTHFVPFYARPNLDLARCLTGATRGIIVANFIENAEPLRRLVERGTAQAAIDSLFEDALRGWRTWNTKDVIGKIVPDGTIKGYSLTHIARAEARAREAKALGATSSAQDIAAMLDALPPIRHRVGFSHGDLHGDNVHVRNNQAILIDFLNAAERPLADDPAALETALALYFPAPAEAWHAVMEELYRPEHLRALPALRPPMASLAMLWNAVRQIRRFGLADQLSDGEYARSVAVHLLRHALRKPRAAASGKRRARMVCLAERLAAHLEANKAQDAEHEQSA